jgi:putative effector of murein hydrolase LrgA (UPF0299 family)
MGLDPSLRANGGGLADVMGQDPSYGGFFHKDVLSHGANAMIGGFALLLLCQLAGEAVSRGLGLPVPGPVLGLVLLFAGLLAAGPMRRTAPAGEGEVGRVADGLLQNLALLFVPAGVGVIKHLDVFASHGLAIALALIGSTGLTLVVTVFTFVAIAGRTDEPGGAT